jgi:hypothetical protein
MIKALDYLSSCKTGCSKLCNGIEDEPLGGFLLVDMLSMKLKAAGIEDFFSNGKNRKIA